MTKEKLMQYMDLKQEAKELQEKVDKIQMQLEEIEAEGCVVDKVSGGMGGIQSFRIEGFPIPEYSRKKTLLLLRKSNLECLEEKLLQDVIDIESYIATIPDSHIRRIARMRAVDGLSWRETAAKMGHGYSEDSVRMALNRYLEA